MSSLKQFASGLRALPKTLASRVTATVAPALSAAANKTFDAGTDAYGVPWAPGADGRKVTLEKTGALKRFLQYVAIGTRLRVSLGVPYAKFQIGRRPVFPRQGAALPVEYVAALNIATSEAAKATLEGL